MEEAIKTILNNGSLTREERGQLLIRTLARTVDTIVNYNYAKNHYKGDDASTVMRDKVASIRNSLVLLLSDVELYMSELGIEDSTRIRAHNRLVKMAERIKEREENGNEITSD